MDLYRLYISRYLKAPSEQSVVGTLSRISVVGIALGVMAMIVVLSVMSGFHSAIVQRLLNAQPHLVVTKLSPFGQKQILEDLKEHDIRFFSQQDVIVRTVEGYFSGAVAYGIYPERLQNLGVWKSSKAPALSKDSVIMGVDLARSLGVFEGDELTVISPESLLVASEVPTYQKVRVAALIRTDVTELDSKTIYYAEGLGLKRLGHNSSYESGFEVKLKNPSEARKIKERLLSQGYQSVRTWEDLNSALFYSLRMEKRLMGLFLGVTVLVSCFSVVSVIFLLVAEKENDIRVLKFIGARKDQIEKIFLYLGLVLGALGVLLGLVSGLFLCWLVKTFPIIKLPDVFLDTRFPVQIEPLVVMGVALMSLVLVVFSAFWPASRASKLGDFQNSGSR